MNVSFSPVALRNIDGIFDYIARDNPAAARKVRDRIRAIVTYLGEYPDSGRPTGFHGIRVCPVYPYPYLVFFQFLPEKKEVRILRVRHAARQPLFLNDPVARFRGENFP